MIFIGFYDRQKDAEISRYCAANNIKQVFVLSPAKYRFDCSFAPHEHIEWAEIIQYRFYYRLLQEIDNSTLVVVNECLRTQNRYDLTYNCIRNFLNQTRHQLVFQYLPLIDKVEDFMVLFDFDTKSRWKRERFSQELLKESEIRIAAPEFELSAMDVPTDRKLQDAYAKEKRKLIDNIGLGDPHTIPRNLHLMSGRAKLSHVDKDKRYIGRNQRFKLENLQTYREPAYPNAPYAVFEFCHNFIDFSDFLALSRQTKLEALVSNLKVDRWYLQRYQEWLGRVRDACAVLQR